MDVLKAVREIVRDYLGVNEEDIVETATLNDFGADSLNEVEIVMAFEEEFDLEIPDEAAEPYSGKPIKEIVQAIEDAIAKKK
ncbi:MAG TPA: acyl carrier protein [Rhodospirillaceae bacterium]|nr:acyl carrier protein [Rhodospirillaceae bacterium]